jgi:hypothetical protein
METYLPHPLEAELLAIDRANTDGIAEDFNAELPGQKEKRYYAPGSKGLMMSGHRVRVVLMLESSDAQNFLSTTRKPVDSIGYN